jgi:hypothetical protein
MDCVEAQKTVLLSIADANKMEEARLHVRSCIHCAGAEISPSVDAIAHEVARRANRSVKGRLVLVVLGVIQLFLALPWLFGSSPFWNSTAGTDTSHLSRDGAIGIVFGLVAISVAYSPRLAVFALPITFVMLLLQTVTGVFDNSQDHVHANFESVHIIGAAISIGVAILARPKRSSKQTTLLKAL